MLNNVRLYLRYVGISIRSQMQYRVSFIMLSIGHLLTTVTEFIMLWALFDRFGSLHAWTLPEAALFYGIVHCGFAISESVARGFDNFALLVRLGGFDRILLRPRSPRYKSPEASVSSCASGALPRDWPSSFGARQPSS